MCEWGSAQVTLLIFFTTSLGTLSLAWFTQAQRLFRMEGRLDDAEKAEKECLEREKKLNARVSDLEVVNGTARGSRRKVK